LIGAPDCARFWKAASISAGVCRSLRFVLFTSLRRYCANGFSFSSRANRSVCHAP
jgi:hypothetical protein